MEYIEAAGARLPRIGLGTYRARTETGVRAVREALAAGYRLIDTAALYDNEEAVGAGIRESGVPREEMFVTTKVWPDRIDAGETLESLEESLAKLRLDHVDLALVHWPVSSMSVPEMLEGFLQARQRGMTRHIGVSNFTSSQLEEAVRLTDGAIVCNQVEHHPWLAQPTLMREADRLGVAIVAYRPLGPGEKLFAERPVREAAERYGKSPAQIVLRWHLQQPNVVAIPKSADPGRIAANLDVFDFELSEDEAGAISSLARPDGRLVTSAHAPVWDD